MYIHGMLLGAFQNFAIECEMNYHWDKGIV